MKVIVCIKPSVDEDKIEIDSKGNIVRQSVSLVVSKTDEYALENALVLKDKYSFEIITIVMGPPNAIEIIRYAYSKGCQSGILISDPALKGSDCLVTSKVLSSAIKKITDDRNFIVICGSASSDSHTSLVPPQISYFLKIPGIFGASKITFDGKDFKVYLIRDLKTFLFTLQPPFLVSIDISSEINPRIAPLALRIKAKNYVPYILKLSDLNISISGKESPTTVENIIRAEVKTKDTKVVDIESSDFDDIKKIVYE